MTIETTTLWVVLIFTIILVLIAEYVATKRKTRNILIYASAFLLTALIRAGLEEYYNFKLVPMTVTILFGVLILIAYFYNNKFHKKTVARKKKKK